MAKFHKLKVDDDDKIVPFYLDSEVGEESGNNDIIFQFEVHLGVLSNEVQEKIQKSIQSYNNEENPLIYNIEIKEKVLSVKISSNKAFPESHRIKFPLIFDKIVSKETISGIIHKIKSHKEIKPELKDDIVSGYSQIKETLDLLWKHVSKIPKNDECYVLTHGDLNLTNILKTEENKVYLIDFDFIGMKYIYSDYSMLLFNLEAKIDFITMSMVPVNDMKALKEGFFKAYRKENPIKISEEELKKRINLLSLMNCICFSILVQRLAISKNELHKLPFVLGLNKRYLSGFKKMALDTN